MRALAGQFFLLIRRRPIRTNFILRFLVRLQLRFLRLIIFRDVRVVDLCVLGKILEAETDHARVHFGVGLFEAASQLRLRHVSPRR